MNKDLEKFRELLLNDKDFQNKLQTAMENYNGEQTEEAAFDAVLVPLAAEYCITATFSEFKDYISGLDSSEMSQDELSQVAGGGKGYGAIACELYGLGFGFTDGSLAGGACFIGGMGIRASVCSGEGKEY